MCRRCSGDGALTAPRSARLRLSSFSTPGQELFWRFPRREEPIVLPQVGPSPGCPARQGPAQKFLLGSGLFGATRPYGLDPPVIVPRIGVCPLRRSFRFLPRMRRCHLRRGSPNSAWWRRQAPLGSAVRAEKPIRSAVQAGYDEYPTALQKL